MKPGDMVKLVPRYLFELGDARLIVGHVTPKLEIGRPRKHQTVIPDNTNVLYVTSVIDERSQSQVKTDTRPFGFKPTLKSWHLVLWEDRPLWVMSTDVELKPIS